jgi:PhnB protein
MNHKTAISPMLSVRKGAEAVEFYKSAFGARELYRMDDESGAVVAQLGVAEADFWVADESPQHLNFSPETLGGGTVRLVIARGFRRKSGVGGLEEAYFDVRKAA